MKITKFSAKLSPIFMYDLQILATTLSCIFSLAAKNACFRGECDGCWEDEAAMDR